MCLQKQVFDITAPGSVIRRADGLASDASAILTLAVHAFFHANAALWRFQDEYAAMLEDDGERRAGEEWADDRARWLELHSTLSAQTNAPWDPEVHRQATRLMRQEKWEGGRVPRAFMQAYPLMAAESVLAHLAQVGAYLRLVAAHADVPEVARTAAATFDERWPQVTEARSAALYPEDRLRSLQGRRVTATLGLRPVDDLRAAVGTGSSLVGGHLDYTTLVFTAADGSVCGLDITNHTLASVQTVLQAVLDRCLWSGPVTVEPN